MVLNYNKISKEEIEENIEFVDWSLIPKHLLTEDIIKKFSCFKLLKLRMWIEECLVEFVIKEDAERFPGKFFFFIKEEFFMELLLKSGDLWCSYTKIWSFFEREVDFNYNEIQVFIKNIVEPHFKNIKIIPLSAKILSITSIESHFKNIEAIPLNKAYNFL